VFREGGYAKEIMAIAQGLRESTHNRFVILPNSTLGQADTVQKGILNTDLSLPLWIHNGDSAMNCDWPRIPQPCDGVMVTFNDEEPRWSFAETNENNQVIFVTEKIPISSNASTGTYVFKSGQDFLDAYRRSEGLMVNGEQYVAPLFNILIEKGKDIRIFKSDKFFCLGTPEDFERSKNALLAEWKPCW
jgi:hypothetical protein